jgi:hypothetical protein
VRVLPAAAALLCCCVHLQNPGLCCTNSMGHGAPPVVQMDPADEAAAQSPGYAAAGPPAYAAAGYAGWTTVDWFKEGNARKGP